jgi:8-oxo-dGTP pyrophosphatase MutT (NUDIX family)
MLTVVPMTGSPGDEVVEEVDRHGRVLRLVTRREMRAGRLRHRTVYLAVQHPDGRLLVHRRSPHKDVWPGWWDVAAGGVVAAGEPWEVAAVRELAEELGVDVVRHGVVVEPIDGGRLRTYDDDTVLVVGRCFRVVTAGPFTFADGEVVDARWVDSAELSAMLAGPDAVPFLPDGLAVLLPLVDLP